MLSNLSNCINPLSANPTKLSNTFKTIRRQFAYELFECVWPFCGVCAILRLELKRFKRCLPCYLYHVYIRILITNITNFLYFHMISDSFVSNFFFFFLNLFISIVCWKRFGKHFHTASTSVYIMIIFYTFKWQNCRHWKNPMEYIDLLLFYMNF